MKTYEVLRYNFDGSIKATELCQLLFLASQKAGALGVNVDDIYVECEVNYDHCYYSGDIPSTDLVVVAIEHPKKKTRKRKKSVASNT